MKYGLCVCEETPIDLTTLIELVQGGTNNAGGSAMQVEESPSSGNAGIYSLTAALAAQGVQCPIQYMVPYAIGGTLYASSSICWDRDFQEHASGDEREFDFCRNAWKKARSWIGRLSGIPRDFFDAQGLFLSNQLPLPMRPWLIAGVASLALILAAQNGFASESPIAAAQNSAGTMV
jgi:hypothetical protein